MRFFRRLGFGFAPADGVFWAISRAVLSAQKGVYQIPFRLMYSKNIKKPLSWRTLISAKHVAFYGSYTLNGYCAHMDRRWPCSALCVDTGGSSWLILLEKSEDWAPNRLIKSGAVTYPKFKLEMSWTWCKLQKYPVLLIGIQVDFLLRALESFGNFLWRKWFLCQIEEVFGRMKIQVKSYQNKAPSRFEDKRKPKNYTPEVLFGMFKLDWNQGLILFFLFIGDPSLHMHLLRLWQIPEVADQSVFTIVLKQVYWPFSISSIICCPAAVKPPDGIGHSMVWIFGCQNEGQRAK